MSGDGSDDHPTLPRESPGAAQLFGGVGADDPALQDIELSEDMATLQRDSSGHVAVDGEFPIEDDPTTVMTRESHEQAEKGGPKPIAEETMRMRSDQVNRRALPFKRPGDRRRRRDQPAAEQTPAPAAAAPQRAASPAPQQLGGPGTLSGPSPIAKAPSGPVAVAGTPSVPSPVAIGPSVWGSSQQVRREDLPSALAPVSDGAPLTRKPTTSRATGWFVAASIALVLSAAVVIWLALS